MWMVPGADEVLDFLLHYKNKKSCVCVRSLRFQQSARRLAANFVTQTPPFLMRQ